MERCGHGNRKRWSLLGRTRAHGRAARNFQTVDMFEPIIAISLFGLVLNTAFNAVSARGIAEQQ